MEDYYYFPVLQMRIKGGGTCPVPVNLKGSQVSDVAPSPCLATQGAFPRGIPKEAPVTAIHRLVLLPSHFVF